MMKFYSAKQVSDNFNVTSATIKNWVNKYSLPHIRTKGGYYKFSDDNIQTIENFLKQRWGI